MRQLSLPYVTADLFMARISVCVMLRVTLQQQIKAAWEKINPIKS